MSPRLPLRMVHKVHVAHLLIGPLTNPDILNRFARLANGRKLVIWFDFDWIINQVRSSKLVSDMNLIIRDVQGMAEVRLQIFVHTLRHFLPQFTYTTELERGNRIASSSAIAYNHLVSFMNSLV